MLGRVVFLAITTVNCSGFPNCFIFD